MIFLNFISFKNSLSVMNHDYLYWPCFPKRIVNTSTRKLPLISTDVNCGLSLQTTCLLINLSTYQLPLRGIPHFTPLPMGEGSGEGPVGGCWFVLLFCIFSFYNKLSPNIAFLISFSCSNTKRATIALNRAVEGSFTLVADFRRSRTPLRSESM